MTDTTQLAFRAILDALAHPTRSFTIEELERVPAPMSGAVAAVALTLCDEDTPVWLDETLAANKNVTEWFAFHTGAPVVTDPGAAAFLFVTGFDRVPALETLQAGTPESPDRSATAVLQLGVEGGEVLRAEGPGIDGSAQFSAPPGFAALWRRNTDRFPLGVDFLLVAGDRIRGLPRTTKLTEMA